MTIYYKQCYLQNGRRFMRSWIPEKFAKVGKVLKLKNWKGEWEDGWLVEDCFHREPEDKVIAMGQMYKKQRSVSDI